MPVCGFCKKQVELKGVGRKKASPETVVSERSGNLSMYSCPFCLSILGFSQYGS